MLEEIEREFEEATKGLEELRHSTSSTDDESHPATRTSMLDEIEREFEAATSGLKQLKINAHTVQDDDKEQAVTESFKQLDDLADNKDKGDQCKLLPPFNLLLVCFTFLGGLVSCMSLVSAAKRQSMLDEIEREFEAATSSLKKLNIEDSTEGDDSEQSNDLSYLLFSDHFSSSMMQGEIACLKLSNASLKLLQKVLGERKASEGKDHDEHSASRKSMLDAIEREFEAATKGHVEKTYKEQAETQRSSMLEEIEREYEAAASAKASGKYSAAAKSSSTINTVQKTSGGSNSGFSGLLKSTNGVCGCFNKDKDGIKIDTDCSINIGEILAEESNFRGSESSSLTTSLNNLFHTHRQETTLKVGKVLGSSLTVTSTASESSATSENIDSLKETLKKLRGLSARDLVNHPNFDEIIEAGTRYEVLSSASIGYISLLAKYKTVIKEGLEASQRVHIAQTRAKLLKETAMEKQRAVDAEFSFAKTLAHQGDALSIKIFAIKKLLVKLEEEKVNVDLKFKSTETNLARLLKEASQAYEEYHVAVRKAKDEQAAEEFALETTKRAEHIWVEFLSSLN
ncbi:hypothetical protein HID58_043992 [Brassica napus]|uniref:Uncharacterized protein n=1 Tax=Brassica napus TaxID=3708 RepID=A0ABQ8BI42_BRANA|nr:hypothetical protein HID58_043992 [Brassica napus]